MHEAFDRMTGDPAGYGHILEAIGMAMSSDGNQALHRHPRSKN
jgi:hypothetical protein